MDTTTIDLAPVASILLGLAFAGLAAAGAWLAARFASFLKLGEDQKVRDYLDSTLRNAIAFGRQKAEQRVAAGLKIEVRDATVAEAAAYVLARTPDALRHFGIDEAGVRDLVTARLPAHGPEPAPQ